MTLKVQLPAAFVIKSPTGACDWEVTMVRKLDVDLRSNFAAEPRAKIVYERLINFCDDPGSKDDLQFLAFCPS